MNDNFLADSLIGVLKNDYDDKEMRNEKYLEKIDRAIAQIENGQATVHELIGDTEDAE